jgi:rhodanese-related sulfurtransferase
MVADDYPTAQEANTWVRRVGVDRVAGYLDGGMAAWAMAGFKTGRIELISAEDLHGMITGADDFVLVDVRAPLEYEENHIEGAINIPVADLRTRHTELNRKRKTVLMCSSGNRSSLGASILKQHGFADVSNVAGGMSGYSAAGYVRECRACVNPHGSRVFTLFGDATKQSAVL